MDFKKLQDLVNQIQQMIDEENMKTIPYNLNQEYFFKPSHDFVKEAIRRTDLFLKKATREGSIQGFVAEIFDVALFGGHLQPLSGPQLIDVYRENGLGLGVKSFSKVSVTLNEGFGDCTIVQNVYRVIGSETAGYTIKYEGYLTPEVMSANLTESQYASGKPFVPITAILRGIYAQQEN